MAETRKSKSNESPLEAMYRMLNYIKDDIFKGVVDESKGVDDLVVQEHIIYKHKFDELYHLPLNIYALLAISDGEGKGITVDLGNILSLIGENGDIYKFLTFDIKKEVELHELALKKSNPKDLAHPRKSAQYSAKTKHNKLKHRFEEDIKELFREIDKVKVDLEIKIQENKLLSSKPLI